MPGVSRDDVHRLRREGLSIRAIADRLGLSRSKVHRTLSAEPDEDGLALDADDGYRPQPPFTFVGLSGPTPCRGGERYVDGNARSFNPLDLYRWAHHGPDSYRQYREYVTDLDRQIAEAGLVMVAPGDGYWWWYRADQITPDLEQTTDPWKVTSAAVPHYSARR
jgi:Homeodomain-like domain